MAREWRFGGRENWMHGVRNRPDRISPDDNKYTTDPRVTARLRRGKTQSDARRFAQKRVNFQTKAGNIFGLWHEDDQGHLRYVVYSHGMHYPLYVYAEVIDKWFSVDPHDASTASVSTAKHMSDANPSADTVTRLTEAMILRLAHYGLVSMLRSLVYRQGMDESEWEERAGALLTDPRLCEKLRKPGQLDEMDVGIGEELEEQAIHACEALRNLGWVPLMLGGWNSHYSNGELVYPEVNPYSRTRRLVALEQPCNAHREMLFGDGYEPKAGTKGGLPALKFYNNKGGEPDWRPVWVAFATMKEARAAERTCRAMREIHRFGKES